MVDFQMQEEGKLPSGQVLTMDPRLFSMIQWSRVYLVVVALVVAVYLVWKNIVGYRVTPTSTHGEAHSDNSSTTEETHEEEELE